MTRTALLVMDVQAGIVGRIADVTYLDRLTPAVAAARADRKSVV